jgi:hypothetical protein
MFNYFYLIYYIFLLFSLLFLDYGVSVHYSQSWIERGKQRHPSKNPPPIYQMITPRSPPVLVFPSIKIEKGYAYV